MTDKTPEVSPASGTGAPIRGNDIDTDQITPTWFMKVAMFDGLGESVPFDQRCDENDEPKDHPLNEPQFQDAPTMVANANFGRGSPREHALQALTRWGIDVIVDESPMEIFAGNRLAFGIPTVIADHETATGLQDWVDERPDGDIDVNVENETVTHGDTIMDVVINDAQQKTLTKGVWDTMALMESNANAIVEKVITLSYIDD